MVQQAAVRVLRGDCVQVMREMPADSVDSVVCDPPYELGFMGKSWDNTGVAYRVETWIEALRVLKPGGHLLAFGGTRTAHRLACAIEDAGFEIRDTIQWIYGSGFPKSHNISKAMDKMAGAEREVVGKTNRKSGNNSYDKRPSRPDGLYASDEYSLTIPATEEAKRWEGWGSALKPAHEPIIMARKPLSEKNLASNVLEWGTGGLNIDASRVGDEQITTHSRGRNEAYPKRPGEETVAESGRVVSQNGIDTTPRSGRFPANLILSHSEGCQQVGSKRVKGSRWAQTGSKASENRAMENPNRNREAKPDLFTDPDGTEEVEVWECVEGCPVRELGDVSRFFYVAKASRRDRTANGTVANSHPTCKPTELMRYLLRLVTPENGTCLDPFAGSGTTGVAALSEGFNAILIEQDEEYADIAEARCAHALNEASSRLPI